MKDGFVEFKYKHQFGLSAHIWGAVNLSENLVYLLEVLM